MGGGEKPMSLNGGVQDASIAASPPDADGTLTASGEALPLTPPSAEPPAPELATVPSSYYQIEGEVGRGGVGVVLRAHDRRLSRRVALKQLQHIEPRSRQRFEREMRITAKLQHPGIVPIHEAGVLESGSPFYAMKLIEGRSLKDLIAGAKTMAERLELLPTVIAVVETIAYAHSQNVVHRDLKPSNVIVGAFGETVVIDWGLAKDLGSTDIADVDGGPYRQHAGDEMTVAGTVVGTPAYMPPEQARGEEVDKTADVYALGAILRQLVTGKTPYSATSSQGVIDAIRLGPPPNLELVAPDAPADLRAVVDKAMARDPRHRYADAAVLLAELNRFATGRLVDAYAYGAGERLRKWGARRRGVVVTAAVAGAVLCILGVWSIGRILHERDDALRSKRETYAKNNALMREQAAREIDLGNVVRAFEILRGYPKDAPDWGTVYPLVRRIGLAGLPDTWTYDTPMTGTSAALHIDPNSGMLIAASVDAIEIRRPQDLRLVRRIELASEPESDLRTFKVATIRQRSFALIGRRTESLMLAALPVAEHDHVDAPLTLVPCRGSWVSDFDVDEKRSAIVVGCADGRIVERTGNGNFQELAKHSPGPTHVAYSGDAVASTGVEGQLMLATSNQHVDNVGTGFRDRWSIVSASHECGVLLVGTSDGRMLVAKPAVGSAFDVYTIVKDKPVYALAVDSNCRLALAVSTAHHAVVVDLVSKRILSDRTAVAARFYEDRSAVVLGSESGTVDYFEPFSGWEQSWRISDKPVWNIDVGPDGGIGALGDILAWFRPERIAKIHLLNDPAWGLAALTDESVVLMGESRGGVALYDVANDTVSESLAAHMGAVVVRPGESALYSLGSIDGCVKRWSAKFNPESGEEVFCLLGGRAKDLAVFGDREVFAASPDGQLMAKNLVSGRLLSERSSVVNRLAVNGSGDLFVTLEDGLIVDMDPELRIQRTWGPIANLTTGVPLSSGGIATFDSAGRMTIVDDSIPARRVGDCRSIASRPWVGVNFDGVLASCKDGRVLSWPAVRGLEDFSFGTPTADTDGAPGLLKFAAASTGGTVVVFDTALQQFQAFNSSETLDNIEYLPRSGRLVATSHDRGLFAVWNVGASSSRPIPLDEAKCFDWLHQGG